MRRTVLMLMLSLLFGIAAGAVGEQSLNAQQAPDPRVADLVQAGKVRVGLWPGAPVVAIKDPATGEVRGPAVDLGRALAERLGVELLLVEYPQPGAVMEGLRTGAWDVAVAAIGQARAAEADFSPPYMQIDQTYLVPADSSIQTVADVDQPGVRIAVLRGGINDVVLSRTLKRAELVRADSIPAAFELLRTGQANARAANRSELLKESARLPGSRVLEDRFDVLYLAIAVPKGHAARLAYISEFVEEAKASGIVQQAIERAGLRGVQVAPKGHPSTQ